MYLYQLFIILSFVIHIEVVTLSESIGAFFLHDNFYYFFMTSKLISVLKDSRTGTMKLSSYGYPVTSEKFSSHEVHCTELMSHVPKRDDALPHPWDRVFFQ